MSEQSLITEKEVTMSACLLYTSLLREALPGLRVPASLQLTAASTEPTGLLFVRDRVTVLNPGWPGTQYVPQA